MNIDISNVENVEGLPEYIPVTGQWSLGADCKETTVQDVEETVCNWMDAGFPLQVEIFHADGRAITGDLPMSGTFVAVRA